MVAPEPPSTVPLREQPFGCARCHDGAAELAWEAARTHHLQSLVDESHYDVAITACACGQQFAKVFTERIDWAKGEDDQTTVLLPIHPAEAAQLQRCPPGQLDALLTAWSPGRRYLLRMYPTGGALTTQWRMRGFWIGPHD